MDYTVVWFKRDLRVHEHAQRVSATAHGPVRCLYVLESSQWAQRDYALQHDQFLRCLTQLLHGCGAQLQLPVGEVPEVLARLHVLQPFSCLGWHEETGNGATYHGDPAVSGGLIAVYVKQTANGLPGVQVAAWMAFALALVIAMLAGGLLLRRRAPGARRPGNPNPSPTNRPS